MTGIVLYHGPSRLPGHRDIVVVATDDTRNRKTGPMLQTWILDADLSPTTAVQTGHDSSVCGQCPLRGGPDRPRRCYVVLSQAPLGVWRAWRRGSYDDATNWTPARRREWMRHQPIRLGSYGDPVAVPAGVWRPLLDYGSTGYTHQWRKPRARPYRDFLMASCETWGDAAVAASMGWRSFVATFDPPPDPKASVSCPASLGKSTCAHCTLCRGAGPLPDVRILPHGPWKQPGSQAQ